MTISAAAISTPAALRTRLPTPALAHPINRLRQLVTNSLLSPSPITVPVPPRYLTDAGHAPPATTASAAFHRQNADHSIRDRRSDRTQADQNQHRGTNSTALPARNRAIKVRHSR
jgi:hypothetical protein